MTTLFEKIIAGDIPCYKVYEDEFVFAFLDIAPLSKGHTLVIPKEAVAYLHELSEDAAKALGKALVKVSAAVLEATGATAYNILQNNGAEAHQVVDHVHFHIIPKFGDEGLAIVWVPNELIDGESLACDIADRITF
jgi:histidine triad (HIT) family protein